MKQIKVTPEERRRLQKRFAVGDNYMLDVLSYRKDGPTARRIRRAALEIGGRYVDPQFSPNCRISYANGQIVQTFNEGVTLEIDIKTGSCTVAQNGKQLEHIDNATMNQWMAAAFYAQTVAEAAMVAR